MDKKIAINGSKYGKARTLRLRALVFSASFGEPGGTRTRDPLIKSQMLYLLSYRPVRLPPQELTFHHTTR